MCWLEDILRAIAACPPGLTRRSILWRALRQDSTPQSEAVREAAIDEVPAALESFFTNLEARGSGETIWSSHLRLNYALYFFETDAAEELVTARTAQGLANEKYTHEDIAARCVDINFAYGDDSQPVIPVLGQIDWEEFDLLAPDAVLEIPKPTTRQVDPHDMGWPNRRNHARLQADLRRAGISSQDDSHEPDHEVAET